MTTGDDEPQPAAEYDDALAATVDRSTIGQLCSSFRSHDLVSVSTDVLEYRPAFGTQVVDTLAVVGPVLAPGLLLLIAIDRASWLFAVGAVALGFFTLRRLDARKLPVVSIRFDFVNNRFIKPAATFSGIEYPASDIALSDIYALQILRRNIQDSDAVPGHELNLVLRDASRINVLAHGDHRALLDDAQQIAKKLGVPVWIYE
jgi:hypothetical protein